jgi:predicted DNA-binding transcriptional regulator AlpA
MAQQWVTIQQVMEELGVARSTIDKWRRDGKFPKFRKYPNGSLRVEQAAVESWCESLELV